MNMRKLCALILALVLLASAAGCAATENGSGEAEQEQQGGASASTLPDTDRSGNPIALPEEVNAVISMAPSITQTLLDLGVGDKLVAVDTYSAMYFGLEDLPTFDMMEPDTEQMAVLDADLVFTSGMSASTGTDPFQPLRDIGVCVADIPSSESLDAMLEDTRFIAACVGEQETCEDLIAQAQAEIDALMAAEQDFWKLVEQDTPPALDGLEPTGNALQSIYPKSRDSGIQLYGREHLLTKYLALQDQKKDILEQISRIENTIKADMGEVERGNCGIYSVSWKSQTRRTFQTQEFAKAHPEIDLEPFYKQSTARPFKVTVSEVAQTLKNVG